MFNTINGLMLSRRNAIHYCCRNIIGAPGPTGLTAMQTGFQSVGISWTAPSPPPSHGYRIIEDSVVQLTLHSPSITLHTSIGVHTIEVEALSLDHLHDRPMPIQVTVNGEKVKNMSDN